MDFFPPNTFNYGNFATSLPPPMPAVEQPAPIEVPLCNYGFAPGSHVLTDRGDVVINDLDPETTTIGGRDILAVTKSICPDNTVLVFTKGCMGGGVPTRDTYLTKHHMIYEQIGVPIPAERFLGTVKGVFTAIYEETALYNILLESTQRIMINGMFVESLPIEDPLAQTCISALDSMADQATAAEETHHYHHYPQQQQLPPLPPRPQLGMIFTMMRRPMYR